jgi:addiction module HigA family antidote
MSIKCEDLEAGRVSFADVTSGRRLAPVHPGEILRDDFLEPMKISVYTLAQVIKVPRSRVNDIVLGRRGITTDTALRLARFFSYFARVLGQSAGALRPRNCWSNITSEN